MAFKNNYNYFALIRKYQLARQYSMNYLYFYYYKINNIYLYDIKALKLKYYILQLLKIIKA